MARLAPPWPLELNQRRVQWPTSCDRRHEGVRRAIGSVLTRAGHVVTEADDGTAGLEVLRSGRRSTWSSLTC